VKVKFFRPGMMARLVAAGLLLLCTSALADDDKGKRKADLSRLVVLGDSLSAGFQNFSLYDRNNGNSGPAAGGQSSGFATLIATQAGANLTLPLISYPGLPPALKLTPKGIIREDLPAGQRVNTGVRATNLSIPGFTLADALSHPFPGDLMNNPIDALAYSVIYVPDGVPACGPIPTGLNTLGLSALACAKSLKPTTVLVSLGNNDALQALTFGIPPTSPVAFGINYGKVLLSLASTGASLVVANIPDVTTVPFLVPAPAFQAQCRFLPQGATAADYMVPDIVNATKPEFNLCTNYAIRSAELIRQARTAVTQYNKIIELMAKPLGVTVVDVNGFFNRISTEGYLVNGTRLRTGFLQGLFSLDGIHPTNTGYAILANEWISTMNRDLRTKIPLVAVERVAATDPLLPR